VTSPRPLASLHLSGPGAAARLEPDASGRRFRGVLAIDLGRAPGNLALRFAGSDARGAVFSRTWIVSVGRGRFAVETLRVDPALVEPPAEAMPRIETERARVAALWKASDERRRWTAPFRLPVDVSPRDNFGVRRVFNGKERSRHGGVDFPAPAGTPVVAPAPGRVVLAEDLYFSGQTVIVDHGAGLFTSYFHLSRIGVRPGDLVDAGSALGDVGATGRVTGPHLHWSARLAGARINPLALRRLPAWPAP
jgi:murein DD-endopeptidase MepM/ murein hydrolase activator NlpD